MPPITRSRRYGGPFEVSKRPQEVLERLGITQDDIWWRELMYGANLSLLFPSLKEFVKIELSQLQGNSIDSDLTWHKLEVNPDSQSLCAEALQTVAIKLQNTERSLPQWLQDSDQMRCIIKWMFAYQLNFPSDDASDESKRKKQKPARQPSQDVRQNTSSPPVKPALALEAAEGGNNQDLGLGPQLEQAVATGLISKGRDSLFTLVGLIYSYLSPLYSLPSSLSTIQSLNTNSVPTSTSPPCRFKSVPTFICVAAPRTSEGSIEDYLSTAIRCPVEEPPDGYNTHRMFDKANMVEMKKKFGDGYANYDASSEPPVPVIHQDLATWHLLQDFGRKVYFENWTWVYKQVQLLGHPDSGCVEQTKAFRPGNHSFVLLLHPGPLDLKLRRSYSILETQVHSSPSSLAVFPALTELEYTRQKLGDLAALGELAAGERYRPKTCFIGKESQHFPHNGCPLKGEESYMAKRNNSACSMHVVERDNRVDQQGDTRTELALGINRWFYQERVPFLKDVGEFRVFIITTNDPRGIRGRRGKHLHSIFTKPRPALGFAAFAVDDYFWSQHLAAYFTPLTQDDLHAFASEVFEGLRAREDWKTYYESLEVGVRLDIGVSSDRRFFVNEITRIWCSDFFSDQVLAEPKRKIVWAVAKALHNYFQ